MRRFEVNRNPFCSTSRFERGFTSYRLYISCTKARRAMSAAHLAFVPVKVLFLYLFNSTYVRWPCILWRCKCCSPIDLLSLSAYRYKSNELLEGQSSRFSSGTNSTMSSSLQFKAVQSFPRASMETVSSFPSRASVLGFKPAKVKRSVFFRRLSIKSFQRPLYDQATASPPLFLHYSIAEP